MKYQKGTTLIETLVAAAVFVVFSVAIYQLYAKLSELSLRIRVKTMATQIASEQIEFIRNLQYSSVGTVNGIPSGVISQSAIVTRNGISFQVDTTIRNIDYPADGTLGGTPNDLSPADNKLVSISVTCTSCASPVGVEYTSSVAPKGLETENGNGALIIKAINANGQPVSGASVTILNTDITPNVNLTDTTDASGVLTIVDAPPSTENYKITVTKSGYSTEQTYIPGGSGNPNPTKPHLTVAANALSQATFAIDQLASLTLSLQSQQCAAITGVTGNLLGTKIIGTGPDVRKTTIPFSATSANNSLNNIEWDTYNISLNGSTYDIAGTNPVLPLSITPGSNQQFTLTLKPATSRSLVVAAVDAAGLPIAGATVDISGPSGNFSELTSVGSVTQTDWSGGSGQDDFTDVTRFFDSDGGIDYASSTLIKLISSFGIYVPSGELTSSTIDFGSPTTFQQLSWLPGSQPSGVGANPVRVQLATNNDNTTWNFIGPDGTDQTFYSTDTNDIADVHNGDRYLRYKIFLTTDDVLKTPSVSDIGITYTSGCLPPGQVDFNGLSQGTYTVTVSKSGYTTVAKDITISGDVYETVIITP